MALGNADVPVGQYSEEIFKFLKGGDIARAKASLGANVKEVLSQVESGSVDCGVVYSTDASAGSHRPVVYPAAVVESSPNAQTAADFLNYLSSSQAVAV